MTSVSDYWLVSGRIVCCITAPVKACGRVMVYAVSLRAYDINDKLFYRQL